jgi:hypothetical protein
MFFRRRGTTSTLHDGFAATDGAKSDLANEACSLWFAVVSPFAVGRAFEPDFCRRLCLPDVGISFGGALARLSFSRFGEPE